MTRVNRPSLTTSALSNWGALATSVAVGLCLTPYVVQNLGATYYGIWILLGSVVGSCGVLDLGVTSAITRYVARSAGQRDYKSLDQIIATAAVFFAVVAVVVIGLSFGIAGLLGDFFEIRDSHIATFRRSLKVLGMSVGLGFPGYLFSAVLRARERFVAANCITILITLLRAGLTVILLSNGLGLIGIAWSHLVTSVVALVLNYVLCKFLLDNFHVHVGDARWSIAALLLSFGAITTVAVVADIMRFNLDSFVIGKWINLPAVGVYGVAALVIRFFTQFITSGTAQVLTPRFSSLEGEGGRVRLQQLFLTSLSVAASLSFGVGTLIILFGKKFLILWVGPEFVEAVPVLYVLAVAYAAALAQAPSISLLYALKRHYLLAAASVVEGIANVALSIYLAPRHGIVGVAIGTALPMLVVKLFIQPVYVSHVIGIPLLKYLAELAPAFLLGVSMVLVASTLPPISSLGSTYFSLVVGSVPFLAGFALLYFFTSLVRRKRNEVVILRPN